MIASPTASLKPSRSETSSHEASRQACIRFDGLLAQSPDYAFERSRIRAVIRAEDGDLHVAKRPVWLVSCWAFQHATMYIAHRVPTGWTASSRSLDDLLGQIKAELAATKTDSRAV